MQIPASLLYIACLGLQTGRFSDSIPAGWRRRPAASWRPLLRRPRTALFAGEEGYFLNHTKMNGYRRLCL